MLLPALRGNLRTVRQALNDELYFKTPNKFEHRHYYGYGCYNFRSLKPKRDNTIARKLSDRVWAHFLHSDAKKNAQQRLTSDLWGLRNIYKQALNLSLFLNDPY